MSMRSNLVRGCFVQNSRQDQRESAFWCFWPVSGPARGGDIAPDTQKPVNCELRPQEAESSEVAAVRKVRNVKALPTSQSFPQSSLVAPRLRPKRCFVGWVPNRQNRSPTDATAPAPPRNGRIPGPMDTWDPKQCSLAPHLARKQIWSAGVSPRTAPKTGKMHFFALFCRFCTGIAQGQTVGSPRQ